MLLKSSRWSYLKTIANISVYFLREIFPYLQISNVIVWTATMMQQANNQSLKISISYRNLMYPLWHSHISGPWVHVHSLQLSKEGSDQPYAELCNCEKWHPLDAFQNQLLWPIIVWLSHWLISCWSDIGQEVYSTSRLFTVLNMSWKYVHIQYIPLRATLYGWSFLLLFFVRETLYHGW